MNKLFTQINLVLNPAKKGVEAVEPKTPQQYIFSIGEAAKFIGISTDTLRNWEKSGRLIPKRTTGGSRRYYLQQLNQFKPYPRSRLSMNQTEPVKNDSAPEQLIDLKKPLAIFTGLCVASVLILAIGLTPGYLTNAQKYKNLLATQSEKPPTNPITSDSSVLGASTNPAKYNGTVNINIPTIFNDLVTFNKDLTLKNLTVGNLTTTEAITAPNIVYSVSGGDGIGVAGGQTPTISNTGVLSIGDKTGKLTLGSGLSISDSQISNSSNIFKTITVGSTSFSASGLTDTLTFAASGGVSVAIDTSNKKVSFSASGSDLNISGFTDGGTSVALTTITDSVGVGIATAATKLHVVSTSEQLRLGFDGSNYTSFTTGSNGNLTLAPSGGTTSITGAVTASSTLGVTGATTLSSTLEVTGTTTLSSTLGVTGAATLSSDLAVNGGSITTTSTTGNLFNTTATTLNIGGAATTVSIGTTTGTSTINNALVVTGNTTLNGNTSIGNATSDTFTPTARIASGSSLVPAVDLGSDLGSALLRFNNLYVNSINSNSTQNFAGQTIFNYAPTDDTFAQASVQIVPTTSAANGNLLGIGTGGYEKIVFDAEGDASFGFDGSGVATTSVTASANPFNVYNHGTTLVATINTSGNLSLTSSNATGTTTSSSLSLAANSLTTGTAQYIASSSVTTGKLLDIATSGNTWTGNGTTSGLVNLASSSTAGTASDSDILLNIARSGANANTAHSAYGVYSSVTNTNVTSGTNIAGYFSATGATTANTAISIGAISTAAATNTGLLLSTLTGGTTSNYQISTGVLTSATTTTNAQLNLGGVVTTGGTTNYGINIGALSGTGTTNYGINIGASTATGTTNYGLNIGGATGAATTNYGLVVGTVSGATTNYGALFQGTWFTGGTATTTKPQLLIEPAGTASTSWSTSGTGLGINGTNSAGNMLDIQRNGTRVARIDYAGGLFLSGSYGLLVGADNGVATPAGGFFETVSTDVIVNYVTAATTKYAMWYMRNAAHIAQFGQNDSGGSIGTGSTAFATIVGSQSNDALQFTTNNTVQATFDTSGNFGIGDVSPDAKFDIDSAATTTNIFGITSTTLTTGEIADITATYAPTDASTNEGIDINLTHTPTVSADNFTGINLNIADGTALGNTVYGQQNSITLTGDAAKTGVGIYSTVTTSSITSDTIIAADLATSATGIIGATTRTNTGLRTQPVSTSANTAGIQNMYGIYSAPSSTLAAGSTENVYGGYFKATGTVASGTVNSYGLYVANPTMDTTGTSKKYGLYIEDVTANAADNNYSAIFAGGRVGIGTATPIGLLDVNTGTSAGSIHLSTNHTDTNARNWAIGLINDQFGNLEFMVGTTQGGAPTQIPKVVFASSGNVGIGDTTPTEATLVVGAAGAGNIYATFAEANSERLCWDASGASLITDCTGTPGDYAEEYGTVDASIEAGDIVTIDPVRDAHELTKDNETGSKAWIAKSGTPYDAKVIGIISTDPNEVIGKNFTSEENPRPVALNGRVPVKVSTENGLITKGDYLTTSSIAGVAMKATRPGPTIGKALADYNESTVGKILAFVNISYADPNNFLASLSLDDEGNLIAPKIKTDKLTISTDVNIARNDNKGLIAYTQGTSTANQPTYNIDVLSSLKNLETAVIEVTDRESTTSAKLADLQTSTATQSAKLAAELASISSHAELVSASNSGILKQVQDDIAGLKLTPPSVMTIATQSAVLADLKVTSEATFSAKLSAYDLTVSNDFKSLGKSSFGNTTIAGDFSVDGTFTITGGNTINSIGTLYLQNSTLATNIDLFSGKILVDNTGKLTAQIISAKEYLGVSGYTVGTGKILAGTKSVVINSTLVKETSRILITPTTETTQSLSVVSKTAQTSFTVSVPNSIATDISFDWFIINEGP